MKLRIKLDEGAKMPTRAHATDAGLDIYTPELELVENVADLYGGETERGDNGFGSSGK